MIRFAKMQILSYHTFVGVLIVIGRQNNIQNLLWNVAASVVYQMQEYDNILHFLLGLQDWIVNSLSYLQMGFQIQSVSCTCDLEEQRPYHRGRYRAHHISSLTRIQMATTGSLFFNWPCLLHTLSQDLFFTPKYENTARGVYFSFNVSHTYRTSQRFPSR